MRTRGFDASAIESIVRGLTPRDRGAAIPGFDYEPASDATRQLSLIDESLNTEFGGSESWKSSRFTCITANGYVYRIDALQGDAVAVYLGVIDRAPPLEVANNGTGALLISGLAAPTAPILADVVEADESTWNELPITVGY
jgi:hypothetical protein